MTRRIVTLVFVVALFGQLAIAQNGNEHWVSTWAASPLLRALPAQQQPNAAPLPPNSFTNQTLRMIVRTSIGGRRIRLQLSNAYGSSALTVGAAHIALRSKDSAIGLVKLISCQIVGSTSTTISCNC